VSSKCFQLHYTCSDRLLAIALPPCSFHLFSPLTVTFPKLSSYFASTILGKRDDTSFNGIIAAFTRYKFARASQVPGMHAQTFHTNRIMEVATRLTVKSVELFITCCCRGLWFWRRVYLQVDTDVSEKHVSIFRG
jgi:hypothetical protein